MTRTLGKMLLSVALAGTPAAAQYGSYAIPGSLGEQRLTTKERVMRSYQDARWQVGFLHLDPRLAITDLGYVSNIYSTADERAESDFKAQADAGLRGFFNLGPKVLVSPFVDFGYNWWQDQDDLRSGNESYGLQLFGDLNRLQLQLQGGRVETQQNLSSELEVPVDTRTDRLEASLDVDFWGPLSLFASAREDRVRHFGEAAEMRQPGLDLSLLDLDSELLRAGLVYELDSGLELGLGYQESESIFLEDPDGRSNRGSGPLVRIAFDGGRLTLDVEVAEQKLRLDARESGDERSQVVGIGQLGWRFTEKLRTTLYSSSRLDASALDSAAIFEGRRSGLSLRHQTGERVVVSAFYEVGEDEFATVSSDEVTRVDDFASYGLGLEMRLAPRLTVELGFLDTRRDSTDPEFDRDLRTVTGRVRFGADLLPW